MTFSVVTLVTPFTSVPTPAESAVKSLTTNSAAARKMSTELVSMTRQVSRPSWLTTAAVL